MTVGGSTSKRLHGLDVARALAMIGMLIAHYVEGDTGSGFGATARDFVDGRAMPLFMVLGGVGISFLERRSPAPDRDLVARAVILLPMGILLQELTTDLAIILQYYALFFVVATALRRLPDSVLLVASVTFMTVGAYANQVWAPLLTSYTGWESAATLADPGFWWSLVVTGYYPFLPAGAFLTAGMWLGRQELRSRRFATGLVAVGIALAVCGSWVGAWIGEQVGASAEASTFRWERLFDATGHSQMPAWVMGATGTSLVVIGLALLAARRRGSLAVLGEMALTFYAYQAIVINWTPTRPSTTVGEEYVLCALLAGGFMLFAAAWQHRFRRGPLENVLRIGSAPRATPVATPAPT